MTVFSERTRRMHEATDHKSTNSTTRQMQRRTLLHTRMLHQPSLGKEIRRQLHRATKARSDHRSANTAIESPNSLRTVDLSQAIERVSVIMLGAHRQEGRIALQSRLDEEERRAGSGANDTG